LIIKLFYTTLQVYDNVPSRETAQPIWRSNVECTSLDSDVMECVADDENDHSCNHSKDVYVRCVTPTWAGESLLLIVLSTCDGLAHCWLPAFCNAT